MEESSKGSEGVGSGIGVLRYGGIKTIEPFRADELKGLEEKGSEYSKMIPDFSQDGMYGRNIEVDNRGFGTNLGYERSLARPDSLPHRRDTLGLSYVDIHERHRAVRKDDRETKGDYNVK